MSCGYFCLPFAKFNLPMKNKMEKITLRNLRKIKIKSKFVDMFCYFYNIKINYQTIFSFRYFGSTGQEEDQSYVLRVKPHLINLIVDSNDVNIDQIALRVLPLTI